MFKIKENLFFYLKSYILRLISKNMVFSSTTFLFLFLPAVIFFYWLPDVCVKIKQIILGMREEDIGNKGEERKDTKESSSPNSSNNSNKEWIATQSSTACNDGNDTNQVSDNQTNHTLNQQHLIIEIFVNVAYIFLFLLSVSFIVKSDYNPFIYFNF